MESFNIAAIPNVDSESTIGCLKRFLFMIKNENKLKVNRKNIFIPQIGIGQNFKTTMFYYYLKKDYSFWKSSKKICNYCLEIFRLSTAYSDGGNNNAEFKQNNPFSKHQSINCHRQYKLGRSYRPIHDWWGRRISRGSLLLLYAVDWLLTMATGPCLNCHSKYYWREQKWILKVFARN